MGPHLHVVSGVSQAESNEAPGSCDALAMTIRLTTKRGYRDRKTIRRASTCLVRRPEADLISGRGIAY
jgi:hypothetical protein